MCQSYADDWESVTDDPDPEDLGYDLVDWEVVRANASAADYVFLPPDETMLAEEAFIVVRDDAVCDLASNV